eukprot:8056377-Karenia_brevis.AAC.1
MALMMMMVMMMTMMMMIMMTTMMMMMTLMMMVMKLRLERWQSSCPYPRAASQLCGTTRKALIVFMESAS